MELIGLNIEIIDSRNKTLIGKKGKIIDETKNMITIQNEKKIRMIKKDIIFRTKDKIIDGKEIAYRPEERIKRI